MTRPWLPLIALGFLASSVSRLPSNEPTAVERGKQALLERAYGPGFISLQTYENAWRHWNPSAKQPPTPYAEAVMNRYGLASAPYPNDGYPMGVRPVRGLLGKGLTIDCMICHGGSIAGQSVVGLGNASLDLQTFFEEFASGGADGYSNGRVTHGIARSFVAGMRTRNPDLTFRSRPLDFPLPPEYLCDDVPAWWHLKKKKTMYATGVVDARSVRSLMQFVLQLNTAEVVKREEPRFFDIQSYLLSLQPPKYPFPIDAVLAEKGQELFQATCAKCHGTYGEKWTYPNKIVSLKQIGTDPLRFESLANERHYLQFSEEYWFAQERIGPDRHPPYHASDGYQAPPLDGIWATAPYLHNGSVPTVYHLLNSKSRPKVFTRSYRTDSEAYDPVHLGWKVRLIEEKLDPGISGYERRKIYDTSQPGHGNGGHTFGDHFSENERMTVIEYLKTL